ncbi:MAG: hypothetical protein KIS65_00575 [Nitrosomonas sp.]|nr:hypothetical protein [Nitrosomonas sp.]MCW5617706.1 hypothetical protein [Nitrosomonas sp.]
MTIIQTLIIGLLMLFSLTSNGFTAGTGNLITPIHEVNAAPARFDGKEINLRGITKEPTRIPLIDLKAYTLEDESGKITILTSAELPRTDIEIIVRVRIENLAIIQGEAVGTTVIELKRYE